MSLKENQDLIIIIDKALNLPKAGIHVGGGIHVDMSDTDISDGWTITSFDENQDIIIDDNIKVELEKHENKSRLNEEEKNKIAELITKVEIADVKRI